MEDERAKTPELKAKKATVKANESRKKKDAEQISSNCQCNSSVSVASTSSATTETNSDFRTIRQSTTKAHKNIYVNVCCMCNSNYKDGVLSGSGIELISC